MSKPNRLLRLFLIAWSIYMLIESAIHFSTIRTNGLEAFWPYSSIIFLQLFIILWASFSLFMAGLLFILSTNPVKYYVIIKFLGLFSLFHAAILFLLSRVNYNLYLPIPNPLLWLPNYSFALQLEASLLLLFALIVLFNFKSSPYEKT